MRDCRILTVTPGPAVDLSASVDRIVPFSKLRCADVRHDPGGGGINVARVLGRFGVVAGAVVPTGGANGERLRRLLKQEDVTAITVPIGAETRQDLTVLERQTGRQYRFVFPAPDISADELTNLFQTLSGVSEDIDFLVVSGSCPNDVIESFFEHSARVAAATGAKLVVDTSGPALRAALDHRPYLIKPNLREFEELTQSKLDSEILRLETARRIRFEKDVGMIALTLGADGALLVTANGAWRGLAPKIDPVSTVGAGDSFLGALVLQLSRGASDQDALRFAIAAGSAALLVPGTELCRPVDVERLLPLVSVNEI